MCLFELRFSLGICPVVGLLGHMVELPLLKGSVELISSSSYICILKVLSVALEA